MIHRARSFALLTVFLCLAQAPAHAAAGAEESVRMLQKAIDTRDMTLVEKYLDVDGILKKGVDAALKDEAALKDIRRYPAAAVLLALGGTAGGGEAVHALLGAEIKEYVRHGVVSGSFAGKPVEGASSYNGMFGKAFRGGDKDKKSFGPAKVTRRDQTFARIATSLVETRKNRSYPLDLVAEKQDGVWRIVEVANMAELMSLGKAGKKQ